MTLQAGNLGRSGTPTSSSSTTSSTSQTSTAATNATSQASQAAVMAQRAQVSLQRSVMSLQAIQAQAAAQSAARNLSFAPNAPNNLGTASQPLPNVPDGLAVNGLVPGVVGVDPANPASVAIPVPVITSAGGTASVTLTTGTSLTLPPTASGASQITVSGMGTVGSITTGGTITPLIAGVSTSVPAGSTISLTNGGTVTFAAGSSVPVTVSTYAYTSGTTPATTVPVPSSWTGVSGLSQATYAAGTGQSSPATTVTVDQTSQQALLTWQSFNIGRNTTLDFDQSLGGADVADWVAINKVAANIAPSQVLGAIQAPGQVYVINQNGIIFGGSSQVNLGALVASSLPIDDNLVARGLLNNPDLQFLFSQLDEPAGSLGPTDAFTPQGTVSSPGSAPAPGSYGTNGGLIAQVDSSGNLSLVSPNGQNGDVVVQAGAQLNSPTTPEHVGGRIALVGPNVNNAGTISTPDGQTILAAGLQVGMEAHPSADPSLRGLDVAVGEVSDPNYDNGASGVSGTAVNQGMIEIPRADLTMIGANVEQNGVVDSSTSVSLNGRVDLLADYDAVALINGEGAFTGSNNLYPTASGVVTFGPGSLTQILPELTSADTIVGTQLALSSLVNVQGGSIDMGPGSMLLAPSAALPSDVTKPALGVDGLALTAGISLSAGNWLLQSDTAYALSYTSGQVYLDADAVIDASGSENVDASVTDNIIAVQLLGTELADSPLQQNGALRGTTVDVDIRQTGNYNGTEWIGTPIGDVSGYVNLIQHTVGQLTTAGGTVAINAGGSTVLQPGSAIDVSGGWINYQGGMVQTTKVVSDGLVFDISQATPDRVYNGIYTGFNSTSAKWGITQNYSETLQTGAQYEAGYIQGGDGGSIAISSPAAALDGNFLGNTVAGPSQRMPVSQVTSTYGSTTYLPTVLDLMAVPTSSSLSLTFQAQDPGSLVLAEFSPTPPEVVFQNPGGLSAVGSFGSALPSSRLAEVDLSPDLVNTEGFGALNIIDLDGNVLLPIAATLNVGPAGSISIGAANVDIEGTIAAPDGNLSFTAYNLSPYAIPEAIPAIDPARGKITLGASADLNTAGLVVDDRPTTVGAGTAPLFTSGGSITLDGFDVDLVSGTQPRDAVDVSGGVDVSAAGKITYGGAGSIVVEAGQDPLLPALLGGQLVWNPTVTEVSGYSGGKGGSFTVKAPLVQIGGSALINGDSLASDNTLWLDATDPSGNLLQPEFFSQGGFTSFTVNGLGEAVSDSGGVPTGQYLPATLIAPNTTIAPVAQSWLATLENNGVALAPTTLLPGLRSPVSLAFNDTGAKDPFFGLLLVRGDFVMDAGSIIETDPQTNSTGGVSINANTAAILGTIIAPGGTISIQGAGNSASLFAGTEAAPTVDLGPASVLSTAGVVDLVPNVLGYRTGSVLNGGTISVSGDIVAEKGAVLDVSGASSELDVAPSQAGVTPSNGFSLTRPVAFEVDSNGGSIVLAGKEELFSDATLLGQPGGPTAQGGSLSVSSGTFSTSGGGTPLDPSLLITQDAVSIPVADYYPAGQTAIGNPVIDADGNIVPQQGYFTADSFNSGGLASLALAGTIQFSGPVTITADQSLKIGEGGIIFADALVKLNAPYVDLGLAFESPLPAGQQTSVFSSGGSAFYFNPTSGTGDLDVTASLIDVGDLSLQGIGHLELNALNGDIRGDGTLDVSGTVTLTAGQIYPTTDNVFTIADYDYNDTPGDSTVIIAASGSRELPLSAGGELNIYASSITQDGVLRAPIGIINLGSGVTGSVPIDFLSGNGVSGITPTEAISATQQLTLSPGSVTSVSAVDPLTGQALMLPYGTNSNGVSWIDPAGNDITVAGNGTNAIPAKSVNLSAVQVSDQAGALIDLSGGGDLYSYSFVTGTGGTQDILASSTSFAIIPGYQGAAAPYYSSTDYTNGQLAVGEQVYLNASSGLAAGVYTLLPARYALEPGAFLITPQSGTPSLNAVAQANGTTLVSGYEFNGLDSGRTGARLLSSFEVESPAAIAARASYDVLSANTFLKQTATDSGLTAPRLPMDAGQLVIAATQTLSLGGSVDSQAQSGALGGLVDIATPSAILIAGPNADLSGVPGSTLVLSSSGLSAFGADSLLIGGYRQGTDDGDSVTVTTSSVTVDNAGASVDVNGQTLEGLSAPDIILVSNQNLTLAPGAEIVQSSGNGAGAASTLLFTGDGTFLRVSSSPAAETVRTGANPADTSPSMVIGANVSITGANGGPAGSVTLDSTHATSFDPSASLNATTVNLDSGQISLELEPPAVAPITTGLVLSGSALSDLQSTAQTLSLLSYSSIDIYGSGEIGGSPAAGVYPVADLALHAAEIRGFSDTGGGGAVTINAADISLDNSPNGQMPGVVATSSGSLTINAATIDLGTNALDLDQYANVYLNASSGIVLEAETKVTQADTTVVDGAGAITASNNLTLNTPLITAGTYSTTQAPGDETITATNGNLAFNTPGAAAATFAEGLGGKLTLVGENVTSSGAIDLPSGNATLHATNGNIMLNGSVDVAGTAVTLGDTIEYSSGGDVTLTSDTGAVDLAPGSSIDVSADAGGGNAGKLAIDSTSGIFAFSGSTINAAGGAGGSFALDVGVLPEEDLGSLDTVLDNAGFLQSISIRDRTDTEVTLSGSVKTASYDLSLDQGSILVTGTIDASDVAATDPNGNSIRVGGTINLSAADSITLASGSRLTVAGENFDNAGQGGSIALRAGSANGSFTNTALNALNGSNTSTGPLIAIQSGSTLDLSVAAENAGSAALGDLTGTLVISAPQMSGNTDLQVAPIGGSIINASSVSIVGDQVFNATDGSIDHQEANVLSNGQLFTGNTGAILNRLYQNNGNATALETLTAVEPGAEIIDTTGNLTLAHNWDLSTYRFGPDVVVGVDGSGAPGVLTLRAAGNVIFSFGASLSDGFDLSNTSFALSSNPMWTAPLLPAGDQSWSYQIVAGADFSGADVQDVASLSSLQVSGLGGSVLIGNGAPALPKTLSTNLNKRSNVLVNLGFFQTIRTGTGDITMDAGGDVQLINNLASVYTAGTQASTLVGFTKPVILTTPQPPNYGAQYSLEGGNINITAQGNIAHYTGAEQADSSKELPNNWLSRQGSVDANGNYVKATSWWVDFSNFFEGVGTLGGGNITLNAGESVLNVDAVAPTNARMPSKDAGGNLLAVNADNLVELGGGDVTVHAGDDINGGVYYVERGQGTLTAGNQILTNATRAAVTKSASSDSLDWLPTTLFVGDGSFTVAAGSDLLLGPVANTFLLPQGVTNGFQNESYFSTYASTDAIDASSLTGTVTLKDNSDGGTGTLAAWYENVILASGGNSVAAGSEGWIASTETNFTPFATVVGLMPSTLNVTAFDGDIDVLGSLTLAPGAMGTINLVAAGSLNGFQVNSAGNDVASWGSSEINLSDANPAGIPGVIDPLSNGIAITDPNVLDAVNALFAESGATEGLVLQAKEQLHADIDGKVLHADDPTPIQLVAQAGNISGFTLFSGKAAKVLAGEDLTDIAFYIQNVSAADVTVVSAGRDIVAYDPNSSLRLQAAAPGNTFLGSSSDQLSGSGFGAANAGDIQIGGPGTLEVLAGRNLNLGVGPNNADGTGAGISSIGNTSDPFLSTFSGADVIAAAGVGAAGGFDAADSKLDFTSFEAQFLAPGSDSAGLYLPQLGALMGLPGSATDEQIWAAFGQLPADQRDAVALNIFYLVLRDAGRNHNTGTDGGYDTGYAAIADLFPPGEAWPHTGDISLTSREIKTTNGGNIDLLAPGGSVTVGFDVAGNQAIDQGILTEDGGNISIFTKENVNVGTSRIFTLHGGNEIIWSTDGNIAAGNSSKTVQSAPPTRVLVDPQSGSVQTDLAGLATGGGIGVLETVVGAPPSDVDLIAPNGIVDAGDAGIRVSGNLNIAATQVLNAGNIQVGGKSAGVPSTPSANIAGLSAASSATGSANNAAAEVGNNARNQFAQQQDDVPSIITVQVLGYGG